GSASTFSTVTAGITASSVRLEQGSRTPARTAGPHRPIPRTRAADRPRLPLGDLGVRVPESENAGIDQVAELGERLQAAGLLGGAEVPGSLRTRGLAALLFPAPDRGPPSLLGLSQPLEPPSFLRDPNLLQGPD